MQSLFEVVLPLFGVVVLGNLATRLGWFRAAGVDGLSSFVFNFAIPCMLFRAMANLEVAAELPWRLLLAYYVGTLTVFAVGWLAARLAGATVQERTIIGFGSAFSNTVLLGIPLVLTVFGEEASVPLFSLIAVHSLVLLTTAVAALELGRGERGELGANLLRGLRGMAANPILIGLVAGLLWRAAGLRLPESADELIALLATAAVPCALFAMGGTLARYRLTGRLPAALLVVALKNLLHPLLVAGLAILVFRLEPLSASVAVVLATLPTGINVYLFADRYDAGTDIASSAVVLSTAVSFATVTVVLAWLAPVPG